MKTLTLSIKQNFFDEIVKGTKKNEYREIRPNNAKRYIKYLCNGKLYDPDDEIPEEGDLEAVPIKYDRIKFLTGAYKGKRPYIIVEVKDAIVEFLIDEDGNEIEYEFEGELFVAAQINYTLGQILERSY